MTDQQYGYRRLLVLSAPLMASLLLEMTTGLTDVLFLGRVGELELGACALGGVCFLTLSMTGIGYALGAQALMARLNGSGQRSEAARAFRAAALALTAMGVLFVLLAALFGPLLFEFSTSDPAVAEAANDYLFWRGLGLPAAFLCALFRSWYVATLQPAVITGSSIVMVAANVVLNALLIFGCGPIPAFGIAGAGAASALAELAALVFFILYARKQTRKDALGLSQPWVLDRTLHSELWRLGRWLMLQEALSCGVWYAFFAMVEHYGRSELALANIMRQMGGFVFLFIHAYGATCGAVAANMIGEGRPEAIPSLCRRGLLLTAASTAAVAAPLALFPEASMRLFTDIPNVLDEVPDGRTAYAVMLASFVPAVVASFYGFAIGSMGFTRAASTATLTGSVIYVLYLWSYTALGGGMGWCWSADHVYFVVDGLVVWYFWCRQPWLEKKPIEI